MALIWKVNGKIVPLPPVEWDEAAKSKAEIQRLRVLKVMQDGEWHTLAEISQATGDPEASVSARLRDMRKPKFGGRYVAREQMDNGLYRYKVLPRA